MIRLDGKTWPPNYFAKRWNRLRQRLLQLLTREVEIIDGKWRYRFQCDSLVEFKRCMKFFIKEPGTIEWIRNEFYPGDVFYDIGANIGIYTIFAAYRTGESGKVFAFEPHSASFTKLLQNIGLNKLQNIIIPCNFALHDEHGYFPFNYSSSEAGSSDSQLSSVRGAFDAQYEPDITELKHAVSIDSLLASKKIPTPHHVKIDVDGNEYLILRGMSKLLKSIERPRSIQVEVIKRNNASILSFMENHNYVLSDKHYTRGPSRRIAQGDDPADYHYNGIFRPVS